MEPQLRKEAVVNVNRKSRRSKLIANLMTEYLGLLDEEFRQRAETGKVEDELKKRIADCEARIDAVHNRRRAS